MCGYIYIVRECEFIDKRSQIYKIGRTDAGKSNISKISHDFPSRLLLSSVSTFQGPTPLTFVIVQLFTPITLE